MSTLSVPLSAELESFIEKMVSSGEASNKADVVRKALQRMKEEDAVFAVLKAQQEPTLKGDIRHIAKKI